MKLKLNQLTLFDYLIDNPVLMCVKELVENKVKKNKYYELVRLLLNANQSFTEYVIYHMIQEANSKLMQMVNQKEMNPYQKSCLENDLKILAKIMSINLDALCELANDEGHILAKMEHEPINHKQEVISAHKLFFDSIDSLELDQRAEKFVEILKKYGVGRFALNYGFLVKINEGEPEFIGIENIVTLAWDKIYLYERQKDALFKNTKAFVEGYSSQNALLVGGSGTGKSTSVKTVAKLFAQEGLRLVQMQKGQLSYLPKVLSLIKNQGFRFILFIDDLSFEANEDEYKFLKSFIEGSISDDLSHVVFYVTSNRRHLIKEIRTERENDIHLQDFIQEMTSLSDRFGLTLIYENLDQKEYFSMVKAMAENENVNIEEEQLIHDARIYAMRHGKMSGRVANQFIKQVKLDAQTT
jgi:hypothetical protein